MDTKTTVAKKAIMVIESRILIDGILDSQHPSHKIAVEKAKNLQLKEEFKDRDILVYAPDKNKNLTTSTYRHHASTEDNSLHTPKNITQGKVRKLRSPKTPKVESIEEMEARIQAMKNLISQ